MESLIQQILKEILKKNDLDDLSIFIRNYQTYEEIPIISRYSDVVFANNYINQNDISTLLLNIAIFYVINIKMYAKKFLKPSEFSNFFVCITFYNIDEDIDEVNYVIPNLFVTRNLNILSFLKEDAKVETEDLSILNSVFSNCNALGNFIFYKVINNDDYGTITRIYAVPSFK